MSDTEKIELIFAPIADAAASFAWRNRLKLTKCPRGNSGWELTRKHRHGGTIYLLLMHDDAAGLGIGSVWQYPCSEMSLIYSHFRKMLAVPLVTEDVIKVLRTELKAISKVKFGYWTH